VVEGGVDGRALVAVGKEDREAPVEDGRTQESIVGDEIVGVHPGVQAAHRLGDLHRAAVELEKALARAAGELRPQRGRALVAVPSEVEVGREGLWSRRVAAL